VRSAGAYAAALVPTPADAPTALALIRELDAEIVERDPDGPIHGLHPGEHADPRLRFFVLTVAGEPAGCGALRQLEPDTGELKRMFVRREFRGQGLSRVLIRQLETGPRQVEALGLYRSEGYADIPRYGEYLDSPDSICMQKLLSTGDA
jgi:GNAT superfamily N-acetyltransferase